MDGASLEMRSALVVITMALLLVPGLASAQQQARSGESGSPAES